MKERHGTPRTIVTDDLEGGAHRQWSGMPYMSWIIDHTGRVCLKAGWTVAADLRSSLVDFFELREGTGQHQRQQKDTAGSGS